ncbi:MAG: universal stress protein [Planctomycetota bacterium]
MGFKLEHILVPVDFSAVSDVVLDRAIALAADYQADVTLLHAIEPPFFGFDDAQEAKARGEAGERLRELVQGRVRELRKLHAWRGVIVTETVVGVPAEEIVDAIDRLDASTVVIGLKPHSALSHAVRPSTTDRVIRRARCPIVIVRAPSWAHAEPEAEVDPAFDWGLAA